MKNKCSWWRFHSWEYVEDFYTYKFLGVEGKRYYTSYRRCKNCKVAEKLDYDYGLGDHWLPLSRWERDVLDKHVNAGALRLKP